MVVTDACMMAETLGTAVELYVVLAAFTALMALVSRAVSFDARALAAVEAAEEVAAEGVATKLTLMLERWAAAAVEVTEQPVL